MRTEEHFYNFSDCCLFEEEEEEEEERGDEEEEEEEQHKYSNFKYTHKLPILSSPSSSAWMDGAAPYKRVLPHLVVSRLFTVLYYIWNPFRPAYIINKRVIANVSLFHPRLHNNSKTRKRQQSNPDSMPWTTLVRVRECVVCGRTTKNVGMYYIGSRTGVITVQLAGSDFANPVWPLLA